MKSLIKHLFFLLLSISFPAQAEPELLFSKEQSLRGAVLYNQHCARCHAIDLNGASASALKGEGFLRRWSAGKQTVADLFYIIRSSMPLGGAGVLSKSEYLDVVTYLLANNDHPVGESEVEVGDPQLEEVLVGAFASDEIKSAPADTCPQVDYYDASQLEASLGPDQSMLNQAGDNDEAWLLPDHGYKGHRFSRLTQIDRDNVADIGPVCTFELDDSHAMQSYLFMNRGSLFFTTNHSTFAIDAASCKLKWKFARKPKCGESWGRARGLAQKDGMLIRGTPDGYLLALNADTGKLIWETRVSKTTDGGGGISMPPTIFEDMVYLGPSPSEVGLKGWIQAFNIHTGKPVWKFHAVPEPGEAGSETWESAESLKRGGGGVWTPFTIDTETATLFLAAGNPGPAYFGQDRSGSNLFTNSVIALDARTGKMRWYKQFVPHDIHDWDLTHSGPLIDIDDRKLVIVSGKDGYVHGVDRKNAELLYSLAVSTQTDMDVAITADKDTRFCPGLFGGVQWNGPAYNPLNRKIFVNSVEWCTSLRKTDEVRYVYGGFYLGGIFKMDPKETYSGRLTAFEPLTGKVNWRYDAKVPMIAAVTPTASNLIFTGELTGDFLALDADSGKVLYRHNTGASLGAGIITYSVDKKQYVAVAAGPASSIWLQPANTSKIIIYALPD